ncbi:hypothetical protein [Thermoclostridium stercorarium]|uniref:hypothetical protein n=1 Tax=Thermoclostridium stercorarium TaxID=1510 RepID=UPI000A8517F0|nr:hypothetical protein [Thermoclostridium stercorarium]
MLSPYISWILQQLAERMGDEMPIITIDTMMVNQREDVVQQVWRLNKDLGDNRIQFYLSIHGSLKFMTKLSDTKGTLRNKLKASNC